METEQYPSPQQSFSVGLLKPGSILWPAWAESMAISEGLPMDIQGTEEANAVWPTNIIVSSSVNFKPSFLIKNTTRGITQ